MSPARGVEPVNFSHKVAMLRRDFSVSIEDAPPGPPRRIDGYTIGAVTVTVGPGPHLGEMHPDGDEFLHVVTGSMELIVDDGDAEAVGNETVVVLGPGDACVVPRGVWHRLIATEPSVLVHVTPGPNGEARPRVNQLVVRGGGNGEATCKRDSVSDPVARFAR